MTGPEAPVRHAHVDCLVAIGQVAGGVAHEINNPLAGIKNAFLLLKDAIPPSYPHYPYVDAVEREIERIADVTRRMVETYRPEQDIAIGQSVAIIIADAVHLSLRATRTDPQLLTVDNGVNLPFPDAAGLLRHAVHQVLTAALQAAGKGTPVVLRVATDKRLLTIHVEYQGASPLSRVAPGSFPTRLIEAMHGELAMTSATPPDAVAVITVPIAAVEAA